MEKAAATSSLARDEILTLLLADMGSAEIVFAAADEARRHEAGEEIRVRGIIEFSNFCRRDCLFCGIRAANSYIQRYRLNEDEILGICERIRTLGIGTVLLQSGEDSEYSSDAVCRLVKRIRENLGLEVTLSIGERPAEEYRAMKEAGAEHYLLRHETADSVLYEKLHPELSLTERIGCLEELKRLGFEVDGGSIVGLPGQSIRSLVSDLLLFKSTKVDMAAIAPFIPARGTPLAFESASGRLGRSSVFSASDKEETVAEFVLKLMALTRLLLPKLQLSSTSALASLLPRGREIGLRAGANVVMINFTPAAYKEMYRVYDDRICTRETGEEAMESLKKLADGLGRHVA
ncbi:MAG: [FeFe] hydrogenase H-cluster radical SAM maturase HydE [Candidatus Eisenbacteria bacterium]